MTRRLRIPKTDSLRIREAIGHYTFLYEDGDSMIFEVEEKFAEEAASETGGLLDMNE